MIQQVAFEVPAEIGVGLASGKYVQWGGVVRDGAGHIVRHLKPADVQNGANKALRIANQAVQLAKQNKKVAIAALAVAGVAAVGGGVYAGVTRVRHSKEDAMRKKRMADFSSAFSEYLKALGEGELTIETIDRLEDAIAALNDGKEDFTVEIQGETLSSPCATTLIVCPRRMVGRPPMPFLSCSKRNRMTLKALGNALTLSVKYSCERHR